MPGLRKIDKTHHEHVRRRPTLAPALRRDLAARPTRKPLTAAGRAVFLTLAGIFLGIAALGAVLPGLPCTPFVLLTSYFLLRSSPRLNDRLLRSRIFGPILRDWQERGGVARHVKVKSILIVSIVVGLTVYFGGLQLWASGAVSLLSLVGIAIIARLPEPRD